MSSGAMVPQTGLKGTGVLVPVVGPQSAGKAALIASARGAYSGNSAIVFPRSLATATRSGAGPDVRVSSSEFASLKAAGAFAVSWQGKEGAYGVPASIFDDLTAGRVVVIGVTRAVIPELRRRHSRVHVIYLTALRQGRPQNLSENDGRWLARISGPPERGPAVDIPEPPVTVIDNSGPLTEAVEEFLRVLETYVPMSS